MPATAIETQISLDREIAQLEQILASLKRRRNALSPVSQLPPEILARIFFLTLPLPGPELAERILRPEDEPRLAQTKGWLCSVSSHWRETAFAAPELWENIHIRDCTKGQYIDFVLGMIGDEQVIYVDAYGIYRNGSTLRRILETGNTRVLKRVSLSAEEWTMHGILREVKARSEGTEELELISSRDHGRLPNLPIVATVFPQLRKLCLVRWRIPSDLHQLSTVTHFALKGLAGTTVGDLRKLLAFFKTAGHIASLELQFQKTAAVFPENILGSAEAVELHHLKRLKVHADNTLILLALLKAIRLPSELEVVDILTIDNSNELSHQLTSALSLTCSDILAPERVVVLEAAPEGAERPLSEYAAFQGWRNGNSVPLLQAIMAVPKDNTNPPNPNGQTCQLYSLPFTNAANPWLLSRLQELTIRFHASFAFWKLIADIPTLHRLQLDVCHLDDCFFRILRGNEDTGSPSIPRIPFPALQSLEIAIATPDHLDIDYARALAHALKRRADGVGEGKLASIREIGFRLCTSQIDKETDDLLSSVALDITWVVKK
ncbi:hypothetical protein DFP72DRAFT_908191 [Ephemerocybe angulata]|uniref:F-box domain-containing protein n=1 Tax=Ephemerocybe angulata TaxID=980116 RepID=A0A8H6HQH9_9AGAR|nr:hypothetical protein DFP72DRAFT_908191 [Tulosesus angulatus]